MALTNEKTTIGNDDEDYATINDLPEEMLEHCCKYADVESLKALRLMYKKISPAATKQLFRHVEVKATEDSAGKCESLLSREHLKSHVTTIAIHTSLNPTAHADNNYNGQDFEEWRCEIDLSEDLESVLLKLGKFQNLTAVELHFAMACAGLEDDMDEGPQMHGFRTAVLSSLAKGLRHSQHTAAELCRLTIENQQDLISEEVATMPEFKAMLSNLDSLALQITTEFHDPAPELNLGFVEVHRWFATDLKKYFLQPVSSNLCHLNLCTSEMEWGFRPPFDPRDLHFPKLVSLALGRVMFAYDWQLGWITGHGKTLEVLALTDCMILCGGSVEEDLEDPSTPDENQRWVYNTRWHEYFDRFQQELPLLKRFIMHFSSGNTFKFEGLQGLEALSRSGAELNPGRYGLWNDLSVYKMADTELGPEWDMDDWDDEPPTAPDCYEEDQKALEELLQAIKARIG